MGLAQDFRFIQNSSTRNAQTQAAAQSTNVQFVGVRSNRLGLLVGLAKGPSCWISNSAMNGDAQGFLLPADGTPIYLSWQNIGTGIQDVFNMWSNAIGGGVVFFYDSFQN